MAIRIEDNFMALEAGGAIVATARFSKGRCGLGIQGCRGRRRTIAAAAAIRYFSATNWQMLPGLMRVSRNI